MANVYLRPMMPGDRWLVLNDLRLAEVNELAALGFTSEQCIHQGMQLSQAYTGFIRGECAGIMGIVDYATHRVPWGVFTTVIDRYPLTFLRASRAWLSGQANLVNQVDARNLKAMQWFAWLGFDVSASSSVNGVPFCWVTRDLAVAEAA